MFCPGEPIIVKCSVRGLSLHWHIGKASFHIIKRPDVTFSIGPYNEGPLRFMRTTIGRLYFYQNESYAGSTAADSTLNSELHMHLNDANDFFEVTCEDSYQHTMTKSITVFPGMFNLA